MQVCSWGHYDHQHISIIMMRDLWYKRLRYKQTLQIEEKIPKLSEILEACCFLTPKHWQSFPEPGSGILDTTYTDCNVKKVMELQFWAANEAFSNNPSSKSTITAWEAGWYTILQDLSNTEFLWMLGFNFTCLFELHCWMRKKKKPNYCRCKMQINSQNQATRISILTANAKSKAILKHQCHVSTILLLQLEMVSCISRP